MDKNELVSRLQDFREQCDLAGHPIEQMTLVEAYPGDSSTSFIVELVVRWADDLSYLETLDVLYDHLFATTDEATRRSVFSLKPIWAPEPAHGQPQSQQVA